MRQIKKREILYLQGATDDDGGYLLKIKLTHKDYADLIASTRETVTATLNKLKKDGVVDFDGKYVIIKSVDKIQNLTG